MHLHRAPGLVRGVAYIFQRAVYAFGLAGDAEFASVPDDLVGKENPFLAWDHAHQILLDFLRIVVRGQFEAAGDAVHVGVDHYAFGLFEPRAEHDVGRLAGDAGEGEEFFHVAWDLAAEIGDDLFCRTYDRSGFISEEAGGADVGLELLGRERGEGFDRRVFAEQFGRDAVDIHVCGLGGENGRDQEFPGAGVGEGAGGCGIELVEALEDFGDAVGSEGIVGGLFSPFRDRGFDTAWAGKSLP